MSPAMKDDEINQSISFLNKLLSNAKLLADLSREQYVALMKAAGQLSRPDRFEQVKRQRMFAKVMRKKRVIQDRSARAKAGIREARQANVFQAPAQIALGGNTEELLQPRSCYVCKCEYTQLHSFYDSMCIPCGDFNYQKRFQTASLEGYVALITGARLKIGYQAALLMLRAGARVIATTRFPADAALRFSRETDFSQWGERLQIHGLDLRHSPSVENFARYIDHTTDRLDILINNAAQTVRRPSGFYAHLMENEMRPFDSLETKVQKILKPNVLCKKELKGLPSGQSVTPLDEFFPAGKLDADLQQVDLREMNSWRLRLADVSTAEMLEVQLVNAVAPFILCSKLLPLMRRDQIRKKYVVNVTAMEGKFHRFTKTDRHPHTNMAKAALNMLTHTSAKDLAKDGIYMNAVDTGWVTDEDPANISLMKQKEHDFHPPLDIVDGAARVCDPFFDGILTSTYWWGEFLKDYKPTAW